jgi:Zn finger protein HypA/HybF involved in hydrogenase expression
MSKTKICKKCNAKFLAKSNFITECDKCKDTVAQVVVEPKQEVKLVKVRALKDCPACSLASQDVKFIDEKLADFWISEGILERIN